MQAWITIKGTQRVDEQSETVQMSTVGELNAVTDGFVLTYEESEASGMTGVKTELAVTPDLITLTRSGRVQTQLVLERGRRHQCAYDTGYGILQIGVYTNSIDCALSTQGGSVSFAYMLDQNGHAISSHEVIIKVSVSEKG